MEINIQKQKEAKDLFLHTALPRTRIADQLGIDRKTLYNWIKDGNWIGLKYANAFAQAPLVKQYYEQLHAINKVIAGRAERPYPTKEESTIIKGIIACIKTMGNTRPVSEAIKHFTVVTDDLFWKNQKLAKDVMPHMDQYVQRLIRSTKLDESIEYGKDMAAFERDYEKTMKELETETAPHGEMEKEDECQPEAATVNDIQPISQSTPIPQNTQNITSHTSKNNSQSSPAKRIFSHTYKKAG